MDNDGLIVQPLRPFYTVAKILPYCYLVDRPIKFSYFVLFTFENLIS